jgi:hypothetical protein
MHRFWELDTDSGNLNRAEDLGHNFLVLTKALLEIHASPAEDRCDNCLEISAVRRAHT